MRKDLLPYWLQNITIRGFEGDDDKSKDDKSKDDKADDDDEDDKGDDDQKGDKPDRDTEGLKSALRKERQQRRESEKELRELKKFKEEQESKDKTETDRAKEEATKATTKAARLAEQLRTRVVDNEIIRLGTKLNFQDVDDALRLIERDEIEIDQDEDDPSKVTVDPKSVEDALKALAKKKPHLLKQEGDGEDRSASKFGGGRQSKEDLDDEALRARYPALARGSRQK